MKAAVLYGPRDMKIESVPRPKISGYEILIKLTACGICGSDIRTYIKGPGGRYTCPIILGHEFVGIIDEVGDKVDNFKIGDKVTAVPIIPCDKCIHCLNGEGHICQEVLEFGVNLNGGFAEYIKIPSEVVLIGGVFKLSGRIPLEENCLIEPLAVCFHGMKKACLKPDDIVVIIGDGPIGLMHVQVARLFGPKLIIVIGHHQNRLNVAQEMGAHYIINGRQENILKDMEELTAGQKPDAVILAMGDVTAMELGIKLVGKGGRVVFFGGCPAGNQIKLDPNYIHYSEIIISGSINCTIDEFRRAVNLLERIKYQPFITHRFSLDRIVDAFQLAEKHKGLKIIITMGENQGGRR